MNTNIYGDPTHYPDGEPTRYRCPYCGTPITLDPHPGCCGELHFEPIPFDELADYTNWPLKSFNEDRYEH